MMRENNQLINQSDGWSQTAHRGFDIKRRFRLLLLSLLLLLLFIMMDLILEIVSDRLRTFLLKNF